MSFEQWLAAVIAATGKSREQLEAGPGQQCMEHAFCEAQLTVEEAVEHYTQKD